MKRPLRDVAVQSPESIEARLHALEKRLDRLASEEEHLQQLEGRLEHRTSEDEEHLHALEERVEHLSGEFAVGHKLTPESLVTSSTVRLGETSIPGQGRRVDVNGFTQLPWTRWLSHRFDLEAWFGRYGALGVASLSILFGVGAFISWALASERLGPWLRVSLGALGAMALVEVGWHLRSRNARRFGNALLALSLAVFHVDVWGAGPHLHLISSATSLAIAALASAPSPGSRCANVKSCFSMSASVAPSLRLS